MIHVGAALLYFLCLGFIKFLGSVGLQFSLNLESFQSLFLQIFFLPPFCLFFENSNSTLGYLKFRSPLMLFSFLFLKFFYLLVFYFGQFLLLCLQVNYSFLLQYLSFINPIQGIFHLIHYSVVSRSLIFLFHVSKLLTIQDTLIISFSVFLW